MKKILQSVGVFLLIAVWALADQQGNQVIPAGGGSFTTLLGGTVVNQTFVVGNGSSITPSGTGTVNIAAASSPIPQSQVGPGFNVKNYGAKGDTQFSSGN